MDAKIERAREGARRLVEVCGGLKPRERALIVTNPRTRELGELLAHWALRITDEVRHQTIPAATVHGAEPPEDTARKMIESDLVFGLTSLSMAHTEARRRATERGARYLSLPDYSPDVLASEALQCDFQGRVTVCDAFAERLTRGELATLSTRAGTRLTIEIAGRKANSAPGLTRGPGDLSSPPDVESNVAPLEAGSNGIAVIDGSIPTPELGLLDSPVTLRIRDGRIERIEGGQAETLEELLNRQNNEKVRTLAELGIGLNPLAQLRGSMLEDEGCLGTVHLGFGSNATIGGLNKVGFHLDMIMRGVTLEVDGEPLVREGELCIEQ